jgi:hypothetical protein
VELRDAIDQITAIRTQLARTERLRGLSTATVAFSSAMALGAAIAQDLWLENPAADPVRYLVLWVGAATIAGLAASLAVVRRMRTDRSELGSANVRLAVEQFAPCVAAGAICTAFVGLRLPDQLWLLPGLWQLLIGLGTLAAHRLLPGGAFAVGAFYLATGGTCLWLGPAALQPWAMGFPFAVAQGALAALLWRERLPAAAAIRAEDTP